MIVYKKFYTVAIVILMSASCSQPAKKTVKTTESISTVSGTGKKGAACCVSKVPSRFAIVKNDSLSLKKQKEN